MTASNIDRKSVGIILKLASSFKHERDRHTIQILLVFTTITSGVNNEFY
jgi:hypothetical protein